MDDNSAPGLIADVVTPDVEEAIRQDFRGGCSESAIARQRGLSVSQVDEILRPLLPDEYGYDWTGCDEVVQVRGMMSGVPILKQIRMPAGMLLNSTRKATHLPGSHCIIPCLWSR